MDVEKKVEEGWEKREDSFGNKFESPEKKENERKRWEKCSSEIEGKAKDGVQL